MARATRADFDIDDGRLSTPQRALVILTSLLVVAALALFALQGLGGGDSTSRRRVTAAPRTKPKPAAAAPTTATPASTAAADSSPGPTGGATTGDGSTVSGEPPPADTTSPPAVEQANPPVPAEPLPQQAGASERPPATEGPAPAAWYVTFHGANADEASNITNVLAYETDGAPIPTPVLTAGAAGVKLDMRELRAMAFGSDGTLFVADSGRTDGKILAFGEAGADGTRPLLGEYSEGYPPNALNPGIQRPYGLAVDAGGNLLVASENSQVVTRLFGPGATPTDVPGTPTATASRWCESEPCPHYPGTFAPGTRAPGDPSPPPPTVSSKDGGLKSPRAVVYVSGNHTVYVADHADASVKAYDATTGGFTGPGKGKVITGADGLSQPVGMAVHNGVLYVADEGTNTVLGLDLITPGAQADVVVPATVGDVTLDRPSGLAFGPDGALYVASRRSRQVARYELSGDGLEVEKAKVFLDDLPDQPEQIVAVPG